MEFKEKLEEHVKIVKKYQKEGFKEEQTKSYLKIEKISILLNPTWEIKFTTIKFLLETESYFIIKSILGKYTDLDNITFKDTRSYFGVLFQNNTRKWICRMFIGEEKTNISFPTDERRGGGAIREEKIKLESLKDLYSYENKLVEVLKRYTN